MAPARFTLDQVNRMDRAAFVRVFGGIFEHSPWVAEKAWKARPFAGPEALYTGLCRVVAAAPEKARLALIRAHPDLVGAAARAGTLTPASTQEQAGAGLNALSPAEIARFEDFNRRYRERFGFPFIICARLNKKEAILKAFPKRLKNTVKQEMDAALKEIYKIACFRLDDLIGLGSAQPPVSNSAPMGQRKPGRIEKPKSAERRIPGSAGVSPAGGGVSPSRTFPGIPSGSAHTAVAAGKVTTHVLDTFHGRPAAGLKIQLSVIRKGAAQVLKTVRTNENGRTEEPLLSGPEMKTGTYEILFFVDEYFRRLTPQLPKPPFLDRVPVRFGVFDRSANYHVPLIATPWSYSTYRGS